MGAFTNIEKSDPEQLPVDHNYKLVPAGIEPATRSAVIDARPLRQPYSALIIFYAYFPVPGRRGERKGVGIPKRAEPTQACG